jgi:hypothetical protein
MAEHKFKIGQSIYFGPKKWKFRDDAPAGSYQITRRLPAADGEFQYVIRSAYDAQERVAKERELTASSAH